MPMPENVKAAAILGAFQGTNAAVLCSTPVDVWGYSVWNGQSTVQNAGVGQTTSSVLTLPFATGHSDVATYGYKVSQLCGQVTHTNMSMIVWYTAYQQ